MAEEMGVVRVVLTGQLIIARPALQGEAAHQVPAAKFFQDTVYRDFIDPAVVRMASRISLTSKARGAAQNFKYFQAHRGRLQTPADQYLTKITAINHAYLIN